VVALTNYLDRHQIGVALVSPADISWGRNDALVPPDVFVVPRHEARTEASSRMRHLPLVVQLLSPSTSRADRFIKRRRYQEAGVPLYWIVNVEEGQVEVWTPEVEFPRIERRRLDWHPAGASEPFGLELADLFRPL